MVVKNGIKNMDDMLQFCYGKKNENDCLTTKVKPFKHPNDPLDPLAGTDPYVCEFTNRCESAYSKWKTDPLRFTAEKEVTEEQGKEIKEEVEKKFKEDEEKLIKEGGEKEGGEKEGGEKEDGEKEDEEKNGSGEWKKMKKKRDGAEKKMENGRDKDETEVNFDQINKG